MLKDRNSKRKPNRKLKRREKKVKTKECNQIQKMTRWTRKRMKKEAIL
jgi:hypothetical protein